MELASAFFHRILQFLLRHQGLTQFTLLKFLNIFEGGCCNMSQSLSGKESLMASNQYINEKLCSRTRL